MSTFRAAANSVSSTFKYASSGRAWSNLKAGAKKFTNKASKAWNKVKNTTVRWAKKMVNTVRDAYHSTKKCLSSGVGKCVKQTAKNAVKKAVDSAKSTVEAIKKDPWKFVATAAAALVATVAVGALCATGVGCLILAGAVAGALSAGTGYMVDVAQGEEKFSWSNLAGTMIEGGLDGALSGGLGRLGGGGLKYAGAAASRLPSLASRLSGAGKTAGGSTPVRAAGGGAAARSGGGSSGSGPAPEGRRSDAQSGAGCSTVAGQRHSFDPSTRVLMADGSAKPIEDLQLGDEVAATDPVTGERAAKPVTFLHVNQDQDLTDVTVRDSETGKSTVLKTTQHHPFWDATDRQWVDAGQLKPGHRLLVHDDKRLEGDGTGAGVGGGGPPGRQVTVVAVRNFAGDERMHDLTVADIHTYYVIAGNDSVLVHNCTSDPILPRKVFRKGENGADNSKQAEVPEGSWQSDGVNLTDGEHAFVFLRDGSVRSMPYAQLETYGKYGAGHSSLAQEQPVFMAGNFEVEGGRITHYNNGSGHYWPNNFEGYMPVRDVAYEALTTNGYPVAPNATWRDWRMGKPRS
ncbi:intein [Micromonospora sagamiensis]|uniref:Intein n=1 Tax=Micromonospora sagamiensis TaxID=47875 RepID=A0A562WC35_9ACTN|nr:intein [Micromonospora sagamiensis]